MKAIGKLRQFFINIGDWAYYRVLAEELRNCKSVLDLGCGGSSPLAKLKKHFYSEGLDIHKPSIEKSKRAKIHDKYKIGDVRRVDKLYKQKSFDAVIALDLIEHLKKKDGVKLLKKMELVAKKKAVILTPNGFIEQDSLGGSPYQVHQSSWAAEEFRKLGYKVYGMRGLKLIRGGYATIKFKPWFFWGMVSVLSQVLVYRLPRFAYQLLAIKDL